MVGHRRAGIRQFGCSGRKDVSRCTSSVLKGRWARHADSALGQRMKAGARVRQGAASGESGAIRKDIIAVLATSLARIYGLVLGLVLLFLTARILGPEGRGAVVIATTWVGLFAGVSGLSLGHVAQKRIQMRGGLSSVPMFVGSLAFLTVLLSGLAV